MAEVRTLKKVAALVGISAACGLVFMFVVPGFQSQWKLAEQQGHFDHSAYDHNWYFEHIWDKGIWYFLVGFAITAVICIVWDLLEKRRRARSDVPEPTSGWGRR